MHIYIAYKYTNVKNKSELKVNLEHLASLLEAKGHKTFLLNRDFKAWGKKHVSTFSNVFTIVKNIYKSKSIIAYINTDVLSPGMFVEFVIGTILRKRIVMCIESSILNKIVLKKFATEIIIYNSLKDLEDKVTKVF